MKYFVIGSGSIGHRHAKNLKILGANITHYSWRKINLEKVLKDIRACNGKAAVVIATATNVRLSLILQCAAAGAALYIEKPIAFRLSDVSKIYALPNEILKRSVAGFMMRYHPIFQRVLKDKVDHIFRASFEIGHDVNQWRQNYIFSENYASDRLGGGVLLDLCHEIDIAFLVCGPAKLVSVRSIQHPDFDEVDIASTLDFSDEKGLNYRIAMDYISPKLIRRGSIIGTDLQIDYDLVHNKFIKTSKESYKENVLDYERNQLFLDLMFDFMCLAEGRNAINPYIPRLDRIRDVCNVIASAWETREFTGKLRANLK